MIRPLTAVAALAIALVVVVAVGWIIGRSGPSRGPTLARGEGADARETTEPAPSAPASPIRARRELEGADRDAGTANDPSDDPGARRNVVAGDDAEADASLLALKRLVFTASDLESQLRGLHELASRKDAAADALAEIATDPSLPVRVRREAALLLANQRGEVAFETLLGLLGDGETNVRLAAVQGLGMLGRGDALGRLTEAFQAETSPGVARAIVQAIGRVGTPEAVGLLLGYLDAAVALEGAQRDTVLATLGGISNADALPAITDALGAASDPELRCALVTALARIADPQSFDVLLATLQDSGHSLTRCAAMQGLGLIGDPRAIPALRVWESAGSDVERSYAETAIRRIESRAK